MSELTLGDKIKFIRKEKHLSQEEFGKLLTPPVSKAIVSRWESNDHKPRKPKLEQIAKIGDVSFDYLIKGSLDTDELQSAIYDAHIGKIDTNDQTIMNNFALDAIVTQRIKNQMDETASSKAFNDLAANRKEKFNNLSISSKKEFLENTKLLKLFEKYNIETDDGVLNSYSDALSGLLTQINIFANDQTTKIKKAVKTAVNKLLDDLNSMDQ